MTRDEHDALCEVEAKEFFIWLDGFCDGIGANTPGTTQVLRIKERLDDLNMRWLDRGTRVGYESQLPRSSLKIPMPAVKDPRPAGCGTNAQSRAE